MNYQAKKRQQEIERLTNERKAHHAETRKVKGDRWTDSNGIEWFWSGSMQQYITLPY